MLLVCLLVQWHNPPVSAQTSWRHSACPLHSGMRLGNLSQVWWHGIIPLPLKTRVLCCVCTRFILLLSISKDCKSLQEGAVLFSAALTKYLDSGSIFGVLSQQMQRGLRGREYEVILCWRHTRERKLPRCFTEHTVQAGACGGKAAEQSSLGHLTSLCCHHHLHLPSAQMWKFRENKQMLFDKSK